jgi:kinesin family protein 18/19
VLAIADIFRLIEADPDFEYAVVINYVEIYNEMIRDLLVPTSGYLELRDDSERGKSNSMQG